VQLQQDGYSVFVVRGTGLPPQGFPDDSAGGRWYTAEELRPKPKAEAAKRAPGGEGQATAKGADYWGALGGGATLGGGGGGAGGPPRNPWKEGRIPSQQPASAPPVAEAVPVQDEGEDEELARAIAMSLDQTA
jgi:hypothetical protein